jgi:dTDP-glucose 4,6-dehydratase
MSKKRKVATNDLPRRLLVTGGAGFIGSAFVRRILGRDADILVVVLDKLTYAGNRANLSEVETDPRFKFVHGDISDAALVDDLASEVDAIVNFAAETHVDRSIDAPDAFIQTDVYGTFVLLDAARRHGHTRYLQVSTDEVYGAVEVGSSRETDPVRPRSPYSASKAGGDLLVSAYHTTYGLPAMVTRATNNFGPYQYPEKIIPLFITNAIDGEPLPLYGDGQQIRDWVYVEDHCEALELVLKEGEPGEIYNVGAKNELTNVVLTRKILALLGKPESLVRSVADRAGHDRRYSVDASKIHALGWQPRHSVDEALASTVEWYQRHPDWWRPLKDGDFADYYRRQYQERLATASPLRFSAG